MYRTDRNNYRQKPKNSTIYTPPQVSQFIFELLKDKVWDWRSTYNRGSLVLDPCSGKGNLLEPWKKGEYLEKGYPVIGMDTDPNSVADWKTDFLLLTPTDFYQKFKKPVLVLCNPPFNGYGNKLGSEVWLDKIIELFGKEIPLVLFTPMGFRLNSKKSLETELAENIDEGISEINRLENQLLATNKKKLELQQKLSSERSKNAHLELKLLANKDTTPSSNFTSDYWPIILIIGLYCGSTWLLSTNQN